MNEVKVATRAISRFIDLVVSRILQCDANHGLQHADLARGVSATTEPAAGKVSKLNILNDEDATSYLLKATWPRYKS